MSTNGLVMKDSDLEVKSRDLRVGMGIGGYDMEITITHVPSKCSITYQQHGSYPQSPHKLIERARMALELMVEVYEDTP